MNAKPIILIVLVLILVLLGFGVHVFLTRALNELLAEEIIPEIQSEYGLEVTYDSASIDLLKRQAELSGLVVRNPAGFHNLTLLTADRGRISFELKSLIQRDPIIVKLVKVNGINLTIERDKERRINIQEISGSVSPPVPKSRTDSIPLLEPAPAQPVPASAAPAADQTPIAEDKSVAVQFRRVELTGTVLYDDRKRSNDYLFNVELTGNNLFTMPEKNQPSTLLTLRGSLASDPTAFQTDLSAFIEPLTDIDNPTFNATGSIKNIDPGLIEEMLHENDMKSGPFSFKPSIACRKGLLDDSSVDVTLNDFEFRGTKLGDTTLNIPVNGPLLAPTYELTGALQSLFENNAGSFLKALIGDKEEPKESGEDKPEEKDQEGSVSDLLVDKLGDSVKELDENPELKKSLRELSDSLFGD